MEKTAPPQLTGPNRAPVQKGVEWMKHEIDAGRIKPFDGVDLSQLSENGQRKAEKIIAEWEAKHLVAVENAG